MHGFKLISKISSLFAHKVLAKMKPFLIQYFSNEQIPVPLEGGDAMYFQHIGEPCCLKWDAMFGFRNPHESTGFRVITTISRCLLMSGGFGSKKLQEMFVVSTCSRCFGVRGVDPKDP